MNTSSILICNIVLTSSEPYQIESMDNIEHSNINSNPLANNEAVLHVCPSSAAMRRPTKSRRRSGLLLMLCGFLITVILLVGVVLVILAFTVFRVKDPTLTMNAVFVKQMKLVGNGSLERPMSINATVLADISVQNPNIATLRFGDSMTQYFYRGVAVGSGWTPGSNVAGKETARANVSVDLKADRLVAPVPYGGVSPAEGIVRLRTRTEVVGRVRVLGIFRRDVGVIMVCKLSLDSNRSAEVAASRNCTADVK
ncbi:hypothetical protein HPP92_005257 [Vanilla planifolia]|uniref:Late embryogenesis abundant protein LEA-2 subgroup domain-containing protein n=1 Tax=Vanilla planifolia TaxID=51239 RepID=A0A835V8X1_VANPL|nr:hypothetical protein HPP92_005257 [Vanilla planifolia]